MRIKKWIEQNVEVRYPFEPEPQGREAAKCKPVRVRIGGVFLGRRWHTPADGGVGLLKVLLGGAVVVFFIMVIAAIVDGISRVVK